MDTTIMKNIITKLKEGWLTKKTNTTTITLGTAICLVALYSMFEKLMKPPKQLRHLPYVPYTSFIKSLLKRKPYGFLSRELYMPLIDKDHEIFVKQDMLGWTVQVVNPEIAKQIFLKADLFPKANLSKQKGTLRQNLLGTDNIVFTHDKQLWKKHRLLLNPAFHRSMPVKLFASLSHKMFKVMDETIDKPIDATLFMENFTLDVIGKAGFDFDFDSITNLENEWVQTYHTIRKSLQDPIFFLLPFLEKRFLWLFPDRQHKHHLVTKFHNMLDDIITNKRRILENQKMNHIEDAEKDLLTLMLESELLGEGSLTNEELKSDLNIFFLAGHDTTANTLSSIIYYLAKHPEIQQRAREEAISILGDDAHDVYPTIDQLKEFTFINQVIKETLRLNGPLIALTPRITAQDTELGGGIVPKGTPIVVNIYDLHHSKYVWKDPEIFNPDRFAKGGEAEQKNREGLTWVPFASGPRMCIGMNFSLAEQRVLISSLLRKYEWRLPEDSIHKEVLITNGVGGILTPKELKINFIRRY
ncbi:cytochrome P450 [Cunninghamella echinulata]|nr:cytochrome P450 [Cunninghamella echinulata]